MSSEFETMSEEQRIDVLERLVEELIKENPDQPVVKEYMTKTGLPYTNDPIEQINSVLRALHFQEPQKEIE